MKALPMKANKETKEVAIPIDAEDGSHIPAAQTPQDEGQNPDQADEGTDAPDPALHARVRQCPGGEDHGDRKSRRSHRGAGLDHQVAAQALTGDGHLPAPARRLRRQRPPPRRSWHPDQALKEAIASITDAETLPWAYGP